MGFLYQLLGVQMTVRNVDGVHALYSASAFQDSFMILLQVQLHFLFLEFRLISGFALNSLCSAQIQVLDFLGAQWTRCSV